MWRHPKKWHGVSCQLGQCGEKGKDPGGCAVTAWTVTCQFWLGAAEPAGASGEAAGSCALEVTRRMWFGGGHVGTHQLGEKSALGSCFLREVSFSLILTSALPFLANVTDLPPLTGPQGFPFCPPTPTPFLPRLWPEKSDLVTIGFDHGGDPVCLFLFAGGEN